MPVVSINLAAQAVNALGSFTSTLDLYSAHTGDEDDVIDQILILGPEDTTSNLSASALRFELPANQDWNTIRIRRADLYLRGQVGNPEGLMGFANDSQNLISILNSTSQVLPTTAAGVSAATPLSTLKTVGTNAFEGSGYALDHILTTTNSTITVDLEAVFQQALDDNIIVYGSTHVVILIKAITYKPYGGVRFDGLTQTSPPVLELEYDYIPDLVVINAYVIPNGQKLLVEFNRPVASFTDFSLGSSDRGFSILASGIPVDLTFADRYTSDTGDYQGNFYEFDLARIIYAGELVTLSYLAPPHLYGSDDWDDIDTFGGEHLTVFTDWPGVHNDSVVRLTNPSQAETRSLGNNPKLWVQADLDDIVHSQTSSEGNDPSFETVSDIYPAETLSQGNEPIIRLFVPLSDVLGSKTLSQGNQVTIDSYLVLPSPENSETLSLGNSPKVRLAGGVDRSLIPHNLIPGKTWLTF